MKEFIEMLCNGPDFCALRGFESANETFSSLTTTESLSMDASSDTLSIEVRARRTANFSERADRLSSALGARLM